MMVGITRNPYETNAPAALVAAAQRLGFEVRTIDLPTVRAAFAADGAAVAYDRDGPIEVDALAPFLLYGFPAAVHGFRVLTRTARGQNPVHAVLIADDKATTAELLAHAGVLQVPTQVVPADPDEVLAAAARFGYPVVLKRTHGAQGRWVRRAADPDAVAVALAELAVEGPGAMIVQPEIVEYAGRSVRAVTTGGRVLVSAERVADADEWRSNINRGARQHPIELTEAEHDLVLASIRALGLRHAGVDLLRTVDGSRVLEVNATPDFTSMQPYVETNLAAEVLLASTGAA